MPKRVAQEQLLKLINQPENDVENLHFEGKKVM
jgi:hypothetical protein